MADFGWYALPILGCFGLYLVWMFLETLLDEQPAADEIAARVIPTEPASSSTPFPVTYPIMQSAIDG